MTRSDFSMDWPHGHQTRDGREARILATDLPGAYSIAAAVISPNESTYVSLYSAEGAYTLHRSDRLDLVNKPAPKKAVEGWIVLLAGGWLGVYHHTTKGPFTQEVLARKRVTITEGEFDD